MSNNFLDEAGREKMFGKIADSLNDTVRNYIEDGHTEEEGKQLMNGLCLSLSGGCVGVNLKEA